MAVNLLHKLIQLRQQLTSLVSLPHLIAKKNKLNCNVKKVINCSGLHEIQVAKAITDMPINKMPKLHYCRGHYFTYQG